MGIYSEYLHISSSWPDIEKERKNQLTKILECRKGRAILTFASAIGKQAPTSIDYEDRVPFLDQLSNITGDKLDIILETPGGSAEIVEDIVEIVRDRFSEVAIIIPGYAKSAGTIMAMAGDEILMESASALGPIDAQMFQNGKRFSAQAFLEGLDKIKDEVMEKGYLNRAYVPILQNISPGEIQNCENTLNFAKVLVTEWLSKYKFKFWNVHSSTNAPVTKEEKIKRAGEIADALCDHGRWLTHARSITIADLHSMRLSVTDYSKDTKLCDAIRRYYTLLKLSFDTTNIYKIYETSTSQIYKYVIPPVTTPLPQQAIQKAEIEFNCPSCKKKSKLQANFENNVPLEPGNIAFPKDNILICPFCKTRNDLTPVRVQVESQARKTIL